MKLTKKQLELQKICTKENFTNFTPDKMCVVKDIKSENIKGKGMRNSFVQGIKQVKSIAYFEVEGIGVYCVEGHNVSEPIFLDSLSGYIMARNKKLQEGVEYIKEHIKDKKEELPTLRAKFLSDFSATPKRFFI